MSLKCVRLCMVPWKVSFKKHILTFFDSLLPKALSILMSISVTLQEIIYSQIVYNVLLYLERSCTYFCYHNKCM